MVTATGASERPKSRTREIFLISLDCQVGFIPGETLLPFCGHARPDDDRDGKCHEEEIGDDVGRAHRRQLGITKAALGTWIRNDLPVVRERLAFSDG